MVYITFIIVIKKIQGVFFGLRDKMLFIIWTMGVTIQAHQAREHIDFFNQVFYLIDDYTEVWKYYLMKYYIIKFQMCNLYKT